MKLKEKEKMLKIKDLYVNYKSLNILQGVSLEIKEGEILSLIGSNGAGKTTLVKAISKLVEIKSGSIEFKGEDITSVGSDGTVARGIVQVPEGRKLFGDMTVKENLEMGAYIKNARADKKKNLEFVYSLFPDLKEKEKQKMKTLSGGQQQMAAIGRALMGNPSFLILDEPSIGLSPIMTQNVLDAVKKINEKGVTVLIAEQNVNDVLKIASRAYVMEQGKIVLSGTSEEILNNEYLMKAYLGM